MRILNHHVFFMQKCKFSYLKYLIGGCRNLNLVILGIEMAETVATPNLACQEGKSCLDRLTTT